MADILVINGPNLNLLGTREPEVYGNQTFEQYFAELKKKHPSISFNYFQSNVEGELINELQRVGFDHDGIIINPGGYTHTSVSTLYPLGCPLQTAANMFHKDLCPR